MAEPAVVCNQIAPLAEVTGGRLKTLSDQDLLASTRRLVGASNQILAELLAHLAEVEARGVHRVRLCTSLYVYCIYELRFSEDAAFRRVSGARLLQKFPALYDVIASGELHLTGLLQVGPHLTLQNFSEVMARAKHRTKKEIAKLVRELDPLPDVPSRIEPLGPALPMPMKVRNPTWAEYVRGLTPVNHLIPGDRPRDWMSDTPFATLPRENERAAGARDGEQSQGEDDRTEQGRGGCCVLAVAQGGESPMISTELVEKEAEPERQQPDEKAAEVGAGERFEKRAECGGDLEELVARSQRYAVQFTASQEYVDLVARAQDLLSHRAKGELEELHLRAMRLLVAELERKRFAVTKRAATSEVKRAKRGVTNHGTAGAELRPLLAANHDVEARAEVAEGGRDVEGPRQVQGVGFVTDGEREVAVGRAEDEVRTAVVEAASAGDSPTSRSVGAEAPRQRGRYIPAAIRRAVLERDGLRCTHRSETGARCAETRRLELHHVHAFGRGGGHTIENVTLRCHAHNDLAAEEDFGAERMIRARAGSRHESLVRQSKGRPERCG